MFSTLRKQIYWSLGAHAALCLFLILSPSFSFNKRFREDKVVWVSVPKGTANQMGSPVKKSADLPKTTIQEQKQAPQAAKTAPKPTDMTYKTNKVDKTKTPPSKTPPAKTQPNPQDTRIQDALARMEKQVGKSAPAEAAQVPETQAGGYTFGNNSGTYVSPSDPEYVAYVMKVRDRILNEWVTPFKARDLGLICKIIIHINERGEVTATEWETKSGDVSYDLSAMRAIEKAAPLDIPPERLRYEAFNEGFVIDFAPKPLTP